MVPGAWKHILLTFDWIYFLLGLLFITPQIVYLKVNVFKKKIIIVLNVSVCLELTNS